MLKLFKRKKTPKVELIFCGILMKSSYINDNIKTLYISHFNICNTIRRALRIKKNANMCKGAYTIPCENLAYRLMENWTCRSNWVVIQVLDDAVFFKVSPEENMESDDNFIYLFISFIQWDTCCVSFRQWKIRSFSHSLNINSLSTHDPLV